MSIYKGTQLISGVATPVEAGRNIGQIIQSLLPITDAGLHLLDGALINGSGIYKAFVDYIKTLDLTASYFCTESEWQASVTQYGVCGKFVYDSTANTVRLPKVTGILEGTIDPAALGDLVEAGLPNITGKIERVFGEGAYAGALYRSNQFSVGWTGTNSNSVGTTINIDASRSNSIYGNSTTVQPQAIKGYYYIVIATGAKTDIEVDIDNIATDLNGKADVSLTNLNPQGTSTLGGLALPSSRYVNLTLGASGAMYTAPANGYVYLMMKLTNAGSRFYINCIHSGSESIYGTLITQAGQANLAQILPIKKGATFNVGYDAYISDSTTPKFRFIYAQGSESEA